MFGSVQVRVEFSDVLFCDVFVGFACKGYLMEVHGWKKEEGQSCSGFMVIVNEIEAMELAHNLLHQILQRSCNSGRLELRTKNDEYFSIAVHSQKDINDNFFSKLII